MGVNIYHTAAEAIRGSNTLIGRQKDEDRQSRRAASGRSDDLGDSEQKEASTGWDTVIVAVPASALEPEPPELAELFGPDSGLGPTVPIIRMSTGSVDTGTAFANSSRQQVVVSAGFISLLQELPTLDEAIHHSTASNG
eukprot:SAG31_NODE_1702_length_7496_cov_2.367311_9_plen_139_part_00